MANKHASLDALFTDIADAIREKTGDTGIIPAVEFPNLIRGRLEAAPPPAYLTFSSPSSFTLKVNDKTKHWDGTLEYSTDASTWSNWDGATTLSSATSGSDNVLYLRGTGNTKITGNSTDYRWVITGTDISCIGNIENLLDYATVQSGAHPTMTDYCYYRMFSGCTSLTQAPALPATTLAVGCYWGMFNRCTNLTQAPSLPATTLAPSCYRFMFEFTAITAIPRIMATTYATDSCKGMFDDIKTLNVYSSSGPGHTYGWTAPASTYCSGMFGSDDGETEWAKLDGSNFPNSGTPTEGVTYYFATIVVDPIVVNITASNISEYFTVTNDSSYYFNGQGSVFTTNNAGVSSSTASTILTAKQDISEISFEYSYSSEPSYDKFTLKVAGSTIENAVSGATTAKSYNGSLTSGQTIEFKYVKDSSVDKNDDKCTFSNMVIKLG